MKILYTIALLLGSIFSINAQVITWSPQFPTDASSITITMDPTKGNAGLSGFSGTVYMHWGVITSASTSAGDWRYVNTTWASTTAPTATFIGSKWLRTLTNPRAYFGVPANETILAVALLFRNADGSKVQKNADGSDMYIPIYPAGSTNIIINNPPVIPSFPVSNEAITAAAGQTITIGAKASSNTGTLNLYFNGNKFAGPVTGTDVISGSVTATTGEHVFIAETVEGGISYYDTLYHYNPIANNIAELPAGVDEGINYSADCTSATLVLYAPNKSNAMVIGDFSGSEWRPKPAFQMNRTSNGIYYWKTITGLTPGVEYAYQYIVDNSIYIADPFSQKVLDPWNDKYIPSNIYPNLKAYPTNSSVTAGKNGYVSVLQSCETGYNWQKTDFVRPPKTNLIIYETLIRDWADSANNRSYQNLIDSFEYFKKLGINAIELMPIGEFSGNESWGYNPTFYCAVDKAYGTKNKLKEFIDKCHQNGMAVILDVVYNQMDAGAIPQGKLYWDAVNNRTAANSPWFNPVATHPYNVFNDLNHLSTATQYLVKRSINYFLTEMKFDGFRFDLAKGFSQNVTNEGTVENYDQQRVDNLNRYYDYVQTVSPGAYVILEFLGQQRAEEQAYANKGYLLWAKNNYNANQATQGWSGAGANTSGLAWNSSEAAFSVPAAVGYMESHDEERLMARNLATGNTAGSNPKSFTQAVKQMGAAAAVFLTVPGPKMIWQFGERAYDVSITFGGSNVANKPARWSYMNDPARLNLYNTYSKLCSLRTENTALFSNTTFSYDLWDNGTGMYKQVKIEDPNSLGKKMVAIANFDPFPQTRTINFQTTGAWYNYVSNGTGSGINGATDAAFNLAGTSQSITLQPGEFHVYLNQQPKYIFTGNGNWTTATNWTNNVVPPNPLPYGSEIIINPTNNADECILNLGVQQVISQGAKITVEKNKKFRLPTNLIIQ
ncbi:MAG: alpha-amylase family glycosyl hydrolase [Bacteroidota bacterium]